MSNTTSLIKHPTAEILRRLLVHSDGRDKFLKIIQYFGKIILWLHVKNNKSKYPKLYHRLIAMTSQFSNTRKIIRLAHFLEPYADFKEYVTGARYSSSTVIPYEKVVYYSGFINSVTGILNDIFDDLYCLGKIGILDRSVAKRAEPIAIKLWFINIVFDIHEIIFRIWLLNEKTKKSKEKLSENDLKKLKDKKHWLYISLVKLTMDFGFCGYDLFELSFSDGVQAMTGFVAGILSFHKLWVKETSIV
ncbi:peroxisomal biogenesis factor 11 [Glomus cerebriforme]|uniref:Peroxisomal biogenesis factor 11 n=1 Tax=Glomus cerebriforme TaxID=658196 RepID=A0A397SJE9_9GLOM|nr:peroxisomal biogenesis factor 11 [Glomus cerebriforme]